MTNGDPGKRRHLLREDDGAVWFQTMRALTRSIHDQQMRFLTEFWAAAAAPTQFVNRARRVDRRSEAARGAWGGRKMSEERRDKGDGAAGYGRSIRTDELPLGEWDDTDARRVEDEAVLRLLVEDLSVGKRQVETGRLRVLRRTRERVEEVDEALERETAEVERVPVGVFVASRPEVRETEDEIIVPIVEEVVVVERRLFLKEELRIRKTRSVERHREQVRLRAHEAVVTRLPPKATLAED